jgi:uncharacterized repeat protein (TIGR03803 family)
MPSKKTLILLIMTLVVVSGFLATAAPAFAASKEKVLHSFNGKDGNGPAGLIFDGSGNLYGTTSVGGKYDYGTVFELSPKTGGGWTETVLHNFDYNHKDGTLPEPSLIFDRSGNLYGTTDLGGKMSTGRRSSYHPRRAGAGRRRFCIASTTTARTGPIPTRA